MDRTEGEGVKVFSIAGRTRDLRQRCLGMTDEERRWRAQYLKDQVLVHGEPKYVPEFYKDTTNVFRRIYKAPMYALENMLKPIVGEKRAYRIRHFVGKGSAALAFAYIATYYMKYNSHNWTRVSGWYLWCARPRMYPGEPGYPHVPQKEPSYYMDFGFYSSPFAGKVDRSKYPPPPAPPQPKKKAVKKRPPPVTEIPEDEICEK